MAAEEAMPFPKSVYEAGFLLECEGERQAYLAALCDLYFRGVEPAGLPEKVALLYNAMRGRIAKSRACAENRRNGARRQTGDLSDSESADASERPSSPRCGAQSNSQSNAQSKTDACFREGEGEREEDREKHCPAVPAGAYEEIVGHLNEVAGTAFSPKSRTTRRHIDARFREGRSVEDFLRVVDVKCAEWKGTDMAKYLRPETLFGPKFEGYLNQKGAGNAKRPDWLAEYGG